MRFTRGLIANLIAVTTPPAVLAQANPACPTVIAPAAAVLSDIKPSATVVRDTHERTALAEDHMDRWGAAWFVIDNPLYGSWEASTYGNDLQKPDAAVLIDKNAPVKGFRPMAFRERYLS